MHDLLKKDLKKMGISDFNSLTKERFEELISLLNSKYEEKDKSVEYFLNSILDYIPCTISVITKDLKYKWVNELLASQIGKSKEEFIGSSMGEITKDNQFSLFTKSLFNSKSKRMEKIIHVEISNYNKFFYVIGKKSDDNSMATIIGLDVTELKVLEEEAKFQSQMSQLGEVTSQIVHEINNPLSAISMLNDQVKYLSEDLNSEEDLGYVSEKLLRNTERVSSMINTITLIIEGTKLMSKKDSSNKKEEIDVEKLLSQVKLIAEAKATKYNVEVLYDNQLSNNKKIQGNFVNLMQVFLNLISNSIDAVERNKEKWVKVLLKEGSTSSIHVEIVDSGNGIDSDIAKNMFKPFYSSKPLGKGNGIGLDLCRKIVDDHQGELFLEQDRKNTTFILKL